MQHQLTHVHARVREREREREPYMQHKYTKNVLKKIEEQAYKCSFKQDLAIKKGYTKYIYIYIYVCMYVYIEI